MNALLLASVFVLAAGEPGQVHDHPKLGKVAFQSTCSAPAQVLLERGLGWLHSFEYERAEATFREAAAADSACALAYWGVAMSNYHPLWAPPTPAELEEGRSAIAAARAAQPKTERERAYVEAIGGFYDHSDRIDHKTRVLAYADAMGELAGRYPDDREAAVFHALSQVAAGTLDNDPGYAREKVAARILGKVLEQQPDHPGVAHYMIHSFDYPPLAQLALPAARSYAAIAPDSAHAQHMPSHIFTRLGYWDEAIASNLDARSSALEFEKSSKMKGAWDQRLHALDYLAYAYLQTGRDRKALGVLEELRALHDATPPSPTSAFALTAVPARVLLERRQWREAAAFELPPGIAGLKALSNHPWALANIGFARAVGAARSGDVALARAEAAKLRAIEDGLVVAPGSYDWKTQVSISRQVAEAWLAHAQGRNDEALRMMRAAADLDDATEKHPVTPGAVLPAREQLGELLLELGRPAEALPEYEASLKRAPNRLGGLSGAAKAARLAGNDLAAKRYSSQVAELTRDSDGTRAEIEEARRMSGPPTKP